MAINQSTKYPGQISAPSAGYPQGSAQNVTTPGDGTGTPLEKDWLNDLWGFLQKLLAVANITPSGNPDTVLASQYHTALVAILGQLTAYVFENTAQLAAGVSVLGQPVVFLEKQVLQVASEGNPVRYFVVTTDSAAPNISLGGGLYAAEVRPGFESGTFQAEVRTPFADVLTAATWNYIKNGDLVTLTLPSGHFVNSTANDFYEVSPPSGGSGEWPADIIPANELSLPVMCSTETAAADWRMGVLTIKASTTQNMKGLITNSNGVLNSSGWGFNQSAPKGLFPQSITYSVA